MKVIVFLLLIHVSNAAYSQEFIKRKILHFNAGISSLPTVSIKENFFGNTVFTRRNKAYLAPGIGIEYLSEIQDNFFLSTSLDLVYKGFVKIDIKRQSSTDGIQENLLFFQPSFRVGKEFNFKKTSFLPSAGLYYGLRNLGIESFGGLLANGNFEGFYGDDFGLSFVSTLRHKKYYYSLGIELGLKNIQDELETISYKTSRFYLQYGYTL